MATTPPRFHRLTVRDVVRQTPQAVSIAFDVPPDLRDEVVAILRAAASRAAETEGSRQ